MFLIVKWLRFQCDFGRNSYLLKEIMLFSIEDLQIESFREFWLKFSNYTEIA